MNTWTHFMDMHSGGGLKEEWQHIFIEAPEAEAKVIFYHRFGHNPERVTCTCCGDDYSISESKSLEQATAYERNCAYKGKGYVEEQKKDLRKYVAGGTDDKVWEDYLEKNPSCRYQTLEQFKVSGKAHFICASDIQPSERIGEVPEEGYVWRD